MKLIIAAAATLLALSFSPSGTHGFQSSSQSAAYGRLNQQVQQPRRGPMSLAMSSMPSPEDLKRIMDEESKNPESLADTAERMKNMSPADMETLIGEMENMPAAQKQQLKSMGMDPDSMLVSMKMMRENPNMMATAQKLMSTMSPEELLEQSKAAQAKMSSMSKEELEEAAEAAKSQMEAMDPDMIDTALSAMKEAAGGDMGGVAQPVPDGVALNSSSDPNVVDAMYRTAEIMSLPPTGMVTFQAFLTLPPITALSGPRDEDLSRQELAECWLDGSRGATRVDRIGFERVWKEVQEYFEEDLMDEARITSAAKVPKSRKGAAAEPGTAEVAAEVATVGANLSDSQMNVVNEQVKNMSDDEWQNMMESMTDIGPEEEARMKAMGADPAMMKKAAEMMKSNPMMRKAAQMMMKNMSPDQMRNASEQAQKQMQNMSQNDLEKLEEQMKKGE